MLLLLLHATAQNNKKRFPDDISAHHVVVALDKKGLNE